MRRLFVPSVVLLVLSVVVMVGSWFRVWIESPSREVEVSLSNGEVIIHMPNRPAPPPAYFEVEAIFTLDWPMLPQYRSHFGGSGHSVIIPCWYFVVFSAALVAIFWRPWSRHRRRNRTGCCLTCGYDLSGVQAVCPECGKPINTQRATA